jgi:putative membrane-bound dehydrogenase-like protein
MMPFKSILFLLFLPSQLSSSAASEATPQHRVPEGFTLEKAAGEPEVVFPMFATLDERGRLFVAESSGLDLYAEITALTRKCRVRLLEDSDGDGRYDASKVFAARLVFPMGIAWRAGKLYVADPPDLVTLEDKDGDGRADERKVILTGFGHQDNGSLHGITFGPDGMLYMTMGSPDGYRLAREDGTALQGESGALIRSRPDGSHAEVLCRGFVNLVEIAFLPAGEWIGTDNWFQLPSGGLRDALVHLVEGGLYPSHPDQGTPQPITGTPLPAVSLFPPVALSGLACYRGAGFPEAMWGNLFTAQHNARKVGRHVLSPVGSTFRSEDFDFVWSDHPDFHPSDVLEDADGSLLVVDTGGWYVEHCPTGKIRDSRAPGGIYRVRFAGARRVEDPWGLKVEWQKASVEELCGLLSDPRHAVRDRAREALALRGESSAPALASLIEAKGRSSALEDAVWPLAALPGEASLSVLRAALSSPEPRTVALAARALASRDDKKSGPALSGLLSHADPRVRMASAEALARCGASSDAGEVLKALGSGAADGDRHFEHALIHALYRLASVDDLEMALKGPHPKVQKAALLLLDQPPRQKLTPEAVRSCLSSPDGELRREAIKILGRHFDWVAMATDLVKGWIDKPALSSEDAAAVRDLILSFPTQPDLAGLLKEALVEREGKVALERKAFLLESLAQASVPRVPRPWVEALERLLGEGAPALRPPVVHAAAVLQAPELDGRLLKLAEDEGEAADLRLEALRAVIVRHPRIAPRLFDLVLGQLSIDASPVSRLAAAEVMARSDLDDSGLKRLLDAVRTDALISPACLFPVLERSVTERTSTAVLDYLRDAVQKGWHPGEEELERVLKRVPGASEEKVKSILEPLGKGPEDQRARLSGYEPLLAGGDPLRGRAVFFGKKVACSTCHRVGLEGGQVGPDLTKVGAVRSGRDILESIVVPSSTFAQGYESYAVVTKDGRVATGVLARQSADAVVLRDSSGKDWRLAKDEIQAMERLALSLMPEGLDRAVSREELGDLLGFLASLR